MSKDLVEQIKPDNETEWMIVSCCIMMYEIIAYVYSKYKAKEISQNHFSDVFKTVFISLIKYYKKYQKAPKMTFSTYFDYYISHHSDEIQAKLGEYLTRLEDEYILYE